MTGKVFITSIIQHDVIAFIISLMYLIIKFLEIFLQRKCFENQMFLGYKSGTEISCLIYEKLLNVSPASQSIVTPLGIV